MATIIRERVEEGGDWLPCADCVRGYYWSDNGPAPRRMTCEFCDGAGGWHLDATDLLRAGELGLTDSAGDPMRRAA